MTVYVLENADRDILGVSLSIDHLFELGESLDVNGRGWIRYDDGVWNPLTRKCDRAWWRHSYADWSITEIAEGVI
jgi:hypothetical protein